MTNNKEIPIECLSKILDEMDYDNYLFSEPTSKVRYYSKKLFKKVCSLINYLIKFGVCYIFAYLIYKFFGHNINWTAFLFAGIIVNAR